MFAVRANQENAIYEQQTAAAAKPLNQGVKSLKTPANKAPKTPFKVPLNDENATFRGGKTGGQGKQDGLFGRGKGGKVEKSAFLTPAGPRNRAPLGNKTTNAKATAFQTPAPPTQEKQSAKHTSPRVRRAKIKVHEAEPVAIEGDAEEREIEYMPPREVPLPDYPDDWPHDRTYPQFEGKNLTRGWWSEFGEQKDSDEDDLGDFSEFERKLNFAEERERKQLQQQAVKKTPTAAKSSGLQKTTRDPLTAKPPLTLKAKSAASALSNPTRMAAVPSFAAPTAAAKARLPSVLASKKPAGASTAPGNARHTAAKAASNSTLGYSKGRAVSANARQPSSALQRSRVPATVEEDYVPTETSPGRRTALDDLFGLQDLALGEDECDLELLGGVRLTGFEEDDELRDFQLELVEL